MPKKTVDGIVKSGNHYVIQVKGNQPTLFKELQRIISEQTPLDYFEEHEKDHGRHSSWHVMVFDAGNSHKAAEWTGLRRAVHVHKKTIKKGKETHSDRLYISDLHQTDAHAFHRGIRGHWTIENSLHWVKDVVHKEDKNRLKKDNGPMNAAIFSSVAINIHRKNSCRSITDSQIKFRADVNQLFQLIRT